MINLNYLRSIPVNAKWIVLLLITHQPIFANPGSCIEAAQLSKENTFEVCQKLLETEPPLSQDHNSIILITQADFLMRKSLFEQANQILDTAFKSNSKMLENSIFRHNWMRSKGALYTLKNDYTAALPFYQQALKISLELSNDGMISSNYNNLGGIHSELGDYQEAIKFYDLATEVYKHSKDRFKQALTMANIAGIYEKQQSLIQAKRYYLSGFKLLKQHLETTDKQDFFAPYVAQFLEDLGRIEMVQDEFSTAETHFNQALNTFKKHGYTREQIRVYSSLAQLELKQGKASAAIDTIQLALDLEQQTENQNSLTLRESLVSALIDIGDFQAADKVADEAFKLSQQAENPKQQAVFLKQLADINQELGAYKQANQYMVKYQKLREQILKALFDESTGQLQATIDSEKNKTDIAVLQVQQKTQELANNQQRMWLTFMGILLLVIVAWFVVFFKRRNLERDQLNAAITNHQSKLKELSVDVGHLKSMFHNLDVPVMCIDEAGKILFINNCMDVDQSQESSKLIVHYPDIWRLISHQFNDEGVLPKDLYFRSSDIKDSLPPTADSGVWIHQMDFLDGCMLLVFIGGEEADKALQTTDYIKKYSTFNDLLLTVSKQTKRFDLTQADHLTQVSNALYKLQQLTQKNNGIDQQVIESQEELNKKLVDLMVTCLEYWQASTQTDHIELAERSGLWVINIDGGRLRTRTMDKYLNISKIPKIPRWRQVVKTAHFILSECELEFQQRKKLNEKLEILIQLIRYKATHTQ